MKRLVVCKRQQVFLSAGLAIVACGMIASPTLGQTASITFSDEFASAAYSTKYPEFQVTGVSADASVLVGSIGVWQNDGSVLSQAFRWSVDTGIVLFTPPPGFGPGTANDVSADGSKVILTFSSSVFYGGGRFSWTADGGYVDIGSSLPGGTPYSILKAISADGSTIVGWSRPSTDVTEAFSRALDGSVTSLGDLPGGPFVSQANDVSADGSVIVGVGRADYFGTSEGIKRAVRWVASSGGYNIEVPDFASAGVCDQDSFATAISDDGTTIVGRVTTADGGAVFRWMADGGFELPFRDSGVVGSAVAVSQDGSLIAGYMWKIPYDDNGGTLSYLPGIWNGATGGIVELAEIQDMLVNDFGVDMGGRYLRTIWAIKGTAQDIILVGGAWPVGDPNAMGIPYTIHLPYMLLGTAPEPTCSATWESAAIGWPGLSTQPPWETYDPSVTEQVSALEVFDDGNGPALYAGGIFKYAGGNVIGNGIAKWDGQNWSPVSIGVGGAWPWVSSLTTLDDGTGPALYATGPFDIAGGVFANKIAKWDGQTWSAMGSGLSVVRALMVFDDGTGPAIYATGMIRTLDGSPFDDGIAKWTGSQWVQLGSGLANSVGNVSAEAVVFDDGTGPALYVLGDFDTAGGLPVGSNEFAKWDGLNWSVISLQGGAESIEMVWDDGTGSAIYFTRGFTAQGPSQFVKWDGQTWTDVFVGTEPFNGPDAFKTLRGEMNDGTGPAMFATTSSPPELYRWDGQDWVLVRPFGCSGTGALIQAVAQFDDGVGNGIYLGGRWIQVGGEITRNIALLRACTIPHPGDCDADGDVDMADFDFFSGCLSGPGGGLGVGCECSDINSDGDVDLDDFQAFMGGFTG